MTQQARSPRFLIVGAAGRNRATGNHAARQLLARGLSVRAFVRHPKCPAGLVTQPRRTVLRDSSAENHNSFADWLEARTPGSDSIWPVSCDRVGRSAREEVYRIVEEVVGLFGLGSAGGNERGDALQGGNQQ
jgi:hypothetical protein